MKKVLIPAFLVAFSASMLPSGAFAAEENHAEPPPPPEPVVLSLEAPNTLKTGVPFTLKAHLASNGKVLSGEKVKLSVNSEPPKTATTNSSGVASTPFTLKKTGKVSLKAVFDGHENLAAASNATSRTVSKQKMTLTLSAPKTIRDGKSLRFTATAKNDTGFAKSGKVTFTVKEPGRKKTRKISGNLKNGKVSKSVKVYRDATVIATLPATASVNSGKSKSLKIKFTPAGKPVKLKGPKPRVTLKKQPMAVTSGANVRVSKISNSVWKSMQGRSWRKGCTPRSQLRLIKTNYYSFDGYRRQGELVVAKNAVPKFRNALNGMYAKKLPIRHMYRVDRFGYSKKLKGADDYKSMAADNTSAFNCRGVVGNPSVKSPHATGRSFDVNPWENPYRSRQGWTPNTYWVGKSHPRVAWRSHSHIVVKTLKKAGFRWTYGANDAHHFDA